MNVHFRFRFVFDRKWNFIFVGIFVDGRKWKNAFQSASSIHHKKVLVLVLKKSLDYITESGTNSGMTNVRRVIQQQFWKKESDILGRGSKYSLTPSLHILRGDRTPNPHDLRPHICKLQAANVRIYSDVCSQRRHHATRCVRYWVTCPHRLRSSCRCWQ